MAFAGHLQAADSLVATAADLADASGQPDALLFSACERFQISFERGRLGEVVELLSDAVARYPEVPCLRAMLALCYCEVGRLEEARPLFGLLAADGFSHPMDNLWLRSLADCAAVCAVFADTGAARRLHELLEPYADRMVAMAAAISGSVTHHLGVLETVLGRLEEAEVHFAAAAATHGRVGAQPWLARTRLEWARMLLGSRQPGKVGRARELLDQALGTAVDLGLGGVERDAHALLVTLEGPG